MEIVIFRRATALAAMIPLAVAVLLAAPCPSRAQLYTWTDEKGVVHMTDRKSSVPVGNAKEIKGLSPPENTRTGRVKKMLEQANANTRMAELRQIADEYHKNHTYSMDDYFVCVDMALELANTLKTRTFNPVVVTGNPKVDTAGMTPLQMMASFNHAWVMVEMAPGVYAAVEATGGFVADETQKDFEYYYQGLAFESPRQAKETDVLIRTVNGDCDKARDLEKDWNARFAGRIATSQSMEEKGKLEAKAAECVDAKSKYAELLARQYRKFY